MILFVDGALVGELCLSGPYMHLHQVDVWTPDKLQSICFHSQICCSLWCACIVRSLSLKGPWIQWPPTNYLASLWLHLHSLCFYASSKSSVIRMPLRASLESRNNGKEAYPHRIPFSDSWVSPCVSMGGGSSNGLRPTAFLLTSVFSIVCLFLSSRMG